MTALHRAAYNGHNAVVELLLEAGPDIHVKDNVSICIICLYIQIIQMLSLSFACMSDPASKSSSTTALSPFIVLGKIFTGEIYSTEFSRDPKIILEIFWFPFHVSANVFSYPFH